MKLNVSKAIDAEQSRKNKVKPLPKIVIGKRPAVQQKQQQVITSEAYVAKPKGQELHEETPGQISSVDIEIRKLKVHRAKLSNQIKPLTSEITARLRKEGGESLVNDFIDGKLPMPDLVEQYSKIQSVQDQIMQMIDSGTIAKPEQVTAEFAEESHEVRLIKYEIRRLDDFIAKRTSKLEKNNAGIKKPKNTDRVNRWKIEKAMAEAKRTDLKLKLKRLRNGS